ncbi:hypothetical protein HJC23_006730 [Cyclotella cryptica]|uniref:Uncharacterized protein n=1 Tax=Cyclotella cryptica TaxID=29204 RepID=A0ABD3PPN2_9STRA
MVFQVGKTQPLWANTATNTAPSHVIDENETVGNLFEQEETNTAVKISDDEMLSFGLRCVGFKENRHQRANCHLNLERFRSNYGVGPPAVSAMWIDLINQLSDMTLDLKYCLLALNWLKLYVSEHVLSGWWDLCGDIIRDKVKSYSRLIQSLKPDKIKFEGWGSDEIQSFLLMELIFELKSSVSTQAQSDMITKLIVAV